jgi:hypothetical protein
MSKRSEDSDEGFDSDAEEFDRTERGFPYREFTDKYGSVCSLQESSLVTPCVWFGINDPKASVLIPGAGWQEVHVEEMLKAAFPNNAGTLLAGRMHLTQEQVRGLLPALQRFAETGQLT